MFDNRQYAKTFGGAPIAPLKLKFIEDPSSRIKVFIGVTSYQEPCSGLNDIRQVKQSATQDEAENFAEQASHSGGVPGTMVGIMKNIKNWMKATNYKWHEICVCLLADGRTQINGQYNNLQALSRMGVYEGYTSRSRETPETDVSPWNADDFCGLTVLTQPQV